MGTVTGYDVLKFVDHGERCYVSADYIQGKPLVQWLKYHPDMGKEELWQWLWSIVHALEQFHRCNGTDGYQYVNPYSIIVSENKKLYFLDLGSRNQEKQLRKMQLRSVREAFLSPANIYYQKADEEEDIYGLGRTLQFILAAAIPEPAISKAEEAKLQKVISKCLNRHSKKRYHTFQEISEQFPRFKKTKSKDRKRGRKLAAIFIPAAAGLVFVILYGGRFLWNGSLARPETTKEIAEKKDSNIEVSETQKEGKAKETGRTELMFDMGMLYFVKLKDYEHSREIFSEIQKDSKLAGYYMKLSNYLLRGESQIVEREVEQVLGKIEEILTAGKEDEEQGTRYDISLLRGYALLDTEEAFKKREEIGERCIKKAVWGDRDEDLLEEKEVRANLAAAYEEEEKYGESEEQYKILMGFSTDEKEREGLYQKRADLYTAMEQPGEALKILKEGIGEIKTSRGLRIQYIRVQCRDSSIDRDICAQTIKENLKDMPEIIQDEEFEKLKQEYEIRIEGEEVWVGR